MSNLSFLITPPVSQIEWKSFEITVRLTYQSPTDTFTNGIFTVNLKYGATNVWIGSRIVTELVPGPFSKNLDVIFTIGTRFFYSGAIVEVIFTPAPGAQKIISQSLDITPAFREFTGGPYNRTPVEGCRWHEEEITATMRESSGGPIITTYGQKVESSTYVTYGLTSVNGFTFKTSGTLTPITSIQFSSGSATFILAMDNEVTDGVFTFTDQEPGWSADTYNSDPIDVINPNFIWQNIFDVSNEATAYDSINNGRIDVENPYNAGNPPKNFPSPNWSVTALPASTANITHGNFTNGILNNINVDFQAVTAASTHLKLEYSLDPTFLTNSGDFNNISPSFLFSGGSFDRSIPRFFNGETASFNITAQNKTGSTISNLPSSDWQVNGFSTPVPDFSFTNGNVSGLSGTFPTGAIGTYSFNIQRTSEITLTGSSLPIPMVSQVSINPLSPGADDITISGMASSDGVHTINVTITVTGPTVSTQIVSTDSTGVYSCTFTSLAGGAYTVTVKETEDPGTSSQNTDTFNIAIIAPPEINIVLTDDPAGVEETIFALDALSVSDEPPLAIHSNRNLSVSITAASPGTSSPSATLTKPDGSNIASVFAGLISTVNQGTMNINGIYIIKVNDYTDGNGQTVQGITRRFIISSSPIIQMQKLEGWGYYPREEGSCSNCPEQNPPISVPNWVESGSASASVSLSNTLTISSDADVSIKNYIRTYNYIFENNGKADNQVGTSYAYLEAGLKINVTSSGDTLSAKDQNNTDFNYKSTGVGLLLKNGPYKFILNLIDVQTGPFLGKRAAVKIFDPDNDKYFISTGTVDWQADFIILKINKIDLTGVQNYVVSYKSMNSTGAFSSSILTIPVYTLLSDTTSNFDTSKVGFGIFENNNQNISSQWEFIRYAFYDSGFELGVGEIYKIGFRETQRPDETDFYRSPNILINASSETQPIPTPGTNNISSIIYRETPVRFNAFNIPVKIRYSIADWDDSAEDSTDGFFKPGFVNYYENIGQFNALNATLSSIVEILPLAGITSENISWDFTHNADRLARRMFIIAIVDAPLLPCPIVIKSLTTNDYLVDDSPVKTDLRCAVREFLPDFYIRDKVTDDGSAEAGGSVSPDITLGHFLGDGLTYDPHNVPSTGGQDPTDPRYPAGFARGETPADGPGGAYQIYNDQKNGEGIKVFSNAWSDFDVANSYFNRVWLRISNRGIIPGPAYIQTFYGDSYTRTDFVPSLARDEAWEQIIGQISLAADEKYIQNKFMTFDAPVGGVYNMHAVSAIPALSGYSTPGVAKSYTLVEFKWHIAFGDFPPADKRHGCLTAFINQPPSFTTNIDTARRWDAGPLEGTPDTLDPNISIWPITTQANNITVKNTNIVFGEDPGTSLNYNPLLKPIINENDDPVNFRKSPVFYKLTFAKKNAVWGLRVDGREFKKGEIIIKISKMVSDNVKLKNFKEIKEYEAINKEIQLIKEKNSKKNTEVAHIKPEELARIKIDKFRIKPYRFFILTKGAVGEIQNLKALITTKKDIFLKNTFFHLYFKPEVGINKGLYKVRVEELANHKVVGGYETIIDIIDQKMIKYVGDEKKQIAYKAEKKIFDEKIIPYQYRVPFIGAGYINNEYFKLTAEERKKIKNPVEENELSNFDKAVLSKKELTKYNKIMGNILK